MTNIFHFQLICLYYVLKQQMCNDVCLPAILIDGRLHSVTSPTVQTICVVQVSVLEDLRHCIIKQLTVLIFSKSLCDSIVELL